MSAVVTMPSSLSAIAWLKPSIQVLGLPRPSMIVTVQPTFSPASLVHWPHSRELSFCSSSDMKAIFLPGSGLGELVGPSQ